MPGAVTGPPGRLGVLVDRLISVARRGPAGVAVRLVLLGSAALGTALLHRWYDPGVLCPLRGLTGVPCPLCGATTVFVELGSGHWVRGLLANPVVVLTTAALLLAPLGAGIRWWALSSRMRAWLLGTALVFAEIWQLVRFGLIGG